MNKRTKIELLIFAIVAAFFLYTQASGIGKNDDGSNNPGSSIETELKSSETVTLTDIGSTDTTITSKSDSIDSSKTESDSDKQSAVTAAVQDGSYAEQAATSLETSSDTAVRVAEDGVYTDKDQVALYIASYGHLPENYITKNEAKAAGWVSSEGNLDEVCPGMSIGGDKFGNREGKLPEKKDRKYFECDINFDKTDGYRGSERIIYSNDGLIYYTGDHYNTFELLYGEP